MLEERRRPATLRPATRQRGTTPMALAETVNAKYVFVDIVGYSRGRTIEAQSHIIETLNAVIREALTASGIPTDRILLLPTGDGVGIALIDWQKPSDVDVLLSLSLLKRIEEDNAAGSEQQRRITIRIRRN